MLRLTCSLLLLSAALPAFAQQDDTPSERFVIEYDRVAFEASDDLLLRPFEPGVEVGQRFRTLGRFGVGRRLGAWTLGLRLGWAEEQLSRRVNRDEPFRPGNVQQLDLSYLTLGPSGSYRRLLTERMEMQADIDAWVGFATTDGPSSAGLDGAGFRVQATTGYRIGSKPLSFVPTLGVYGRLAHRFADGGVESPYGGLPFPPSAAVSDFEMGVRTALPVVLRIGGVSGTMETYVDWGSGTATNGLRTNVGVGFRIGL